MRLNGRAAQWIAVLTASAFLNGCFAHHPVMETAPPAPGTAPDGSPLSGNYDDGLRDGEAAAEAKTVAGYVVLGAIAAPLLVLCIVAAAGGGGGGGNVGNCGGGGGGGGGSSTRVVPMDASYRTDAYLSGYHEGYNNRLDQRQENAFLGGFLAGLLITGGILAFLYFDDQQRDQTEDELGNHATAGRRGGVLLEF